jgi:DNA-binding NtrC family response regulator
MSSRPLPGRVLIVDDEAEIRALLARLVRQEGYEPLEAVDCNEALAGIRRDAPDALLLDARSGAQGIEVLARAKQLDPDLPVVMIAAQGAVSDAVAALRAGAHDFLLKPFDHDDVVRSLHSAMRSRELQRMLGPLSRHVPGTAHLHGMMGASEAISQICMDIVRVASCDFAVLITGEPGSGKELVARAIHQLSRRKHAPFVAVDCAALPESVIESELFGYDAGAFVGAHESKPGKFEVANGGTVYLDEISAIPLRLQARLLRAVQERAVYRLGSTIPLYADARLLVASSADLEVATAQGTFRKDLFFRLSEFVIHVPPLRERREDIAFLAKRFLDLTNQEVGKAVEGFSHPAVERLLAFDWPTNVRQLRSTIRRAVLLADTVVEEGHLGLLEERQERHPSSAAAPMRGKGHKEVPVKQLVQPTNATAERAALLDALRRTGWNRSRAARLLQIDEATMQGKLKEYELRAPGKKAQDKKES